MVRGTSSADRIDGWRDRTGPATITRTQGSLVVSGKTKPFPLWNEGEEKTSSPSFLALIMDGVEAASRVCDERRCAAPLTPLPPRWGLVSLDNANVVIDGMTKEKGAALLARDDRAWAEPLIPRQAQGRLSTPLRSGMTKVGASGSSP